MHEYCITMVLVTETEYHANKMSFFKIYFGYTLIEFQSVLNYGDVKNKLR